MAMQLPQVAATSLTVVTVMLVALLADGCEAGRDAGSTAVAPAPTVASPGGSYPAGPGREPRTLAAATRLARTEESRYRSGDYAGAWALWTSSAQRVFGRADFVGYHAACPGGRVPLEVTGVRLSGPLTAVVEMRAAGYRASYEPRYEHGHWRWQPTDEDLAFYRRGLAGAIAEAKAEGSCG
jgi:hypothetical protein